MCAARKQAWLLLSTVAAFNVTYAYAQSPSCDFSPLVLTSKFKHNFPFGSEQIDTETKVTLTFEQLPNGDVAINRRADTFLFQIGEKIAAQIDAIRPQLPNNRCGAKASIPSRNAQVTPPTFTVSATADGSFSTCLPVPEAPKIPYPCGVDGFPPHVKICYKDNPIKLPAPPPAKIGSGTASVNIALKPSFAENNHVKITMEKRVETHVDNNTGFLVALILDPIIAKFALEAINSAMTDFANKSVQTFLPGFEQTISIDNKDERIEWRPKSTQFDAVDYGDGTKLPTFVVVQQFTTTPPIACYLRSAARALTP
jgi:hypothetical protein